MKTSEVGTSASVANCIKPSHLALNQREVFWDSDMCRSNWTYLPLILYLGIGRSQNFLALKHKRKGGLVNLYPSITVTLCTEQQIVNSGFGQA